MFITDDLKKKFVRDVGVPIKVLEEPYFSHYLDLYEEEFQSKTKWDEFMEFLQLFEDADDYFEKYNEVKDAAIEYLKSQPKLTYFRQNEDMNKYSIKNINIPKSGIYKEDNVGKYFISIDMKKANFTALRYYDPEIFDYAETYEEFVKKFTKHEYLIKSKHIRQVIMGNVVTKRVGTYEKYLMDKVLSEFLKILPISTNDVAFFGDDEIVIDVSKFVINGVINENIEFEISKIINSQRSKGINLSKEYFLLCRLEGTKGYLKEYIAPTSQSKKHEIKCVDAVAMPFVIRMMNNEEPDEKDSIYVDSEGNLVKLIRPYKVSIRKCQH